MGQAWLVVEPSLAQKTPVEVAPPEAQEQWAVLTGQSAARQALSLLPQAVLVCALVATGLAMRYLAVQQCSPCCLGLGSVRLVLWRLRC